MGFPMLVAAIRMSGHRQWRIAQMAGISETRLSRIVRRGSATDEERKRLSELLGVPVDQLFARGPEVKVTKLDLGSAA